MRFKGLEKFQVHVQIYVNGGTFFAPIILFPQRLT